MPARKRELSHKFALIDIMQDAGLKEVQSAKNTAILPTWTTKRNNQLIKSRIDYIWLSIDLFQDLGAVNVFVDELFNTDHNLLTTTIKCNALSKAQSFVKEKRLNGFKRTIFDLDSMTLDDWEKYQECITTQIESSKKLQYLLAQCLCNNNWTNEVWREVAKIFAYGKKQAGRTKTITRKDKRDKLYKVYNAKYKDIRWCIGWRLLNI